MGLPEQIRTLEDRAAVRGTDRRDEIRVALDGMGLHALPASILRDAVRRLGYSTGGKGKAALIAAIRRVPLQRIEQLESADS